MRRYYLCVLLSIFLFQCGNKPPKQTPENPPKKDEKVEVKRKLAMVLDNNEWYYIDTSGEKVLGPYPLAREFSEGVACVNIGGERSPLQNGATGGKFVFIDAQGNEQFNNPVYSPTNFVENRALVQDKNGLWGFLNRKGKVIASGFSNAFNFSEGFAPAVSRNEDTIGFIDTNGVWKIVYSNDHIVWPFSEGFAPVRKSGRCGYINKAGEMVISFQYNEAYGFSEGLAAVRLGPVYGFIDTTGKRVIKPQYEVVSDFHEGLCGVMHRGNTFFINTKGEKVFELGDVVVKDFSEGLAAFQDRGGKIGFIDTKGNVAIEPQYENAYAFKNGYCIVQMNGKMGLIDKEGVLVVDCIYERVGNFEIPTESNPSIHEN